MSRSQYEVFELPFDLERIKKLGISQHTINNINNNTYHGITKDTLKKIYDLYCKQYSKLNKCKLEILSLLTDDLKGKVHSIRGRIKEPDHLIEKIIRNVNLKPDKYDGINEENYFKIVTDLIGFRVIILDKRDWREIHQSLLDIFRNIPERYITKPREIVDNYDKYSEKIEKTVDKINFSYHAEKPNVYITSKDDRALYVDEYLNVDNSKTHYRSIHYVIRYVDMLNSLSTAAD